MITIEEFKKKQSETSRLIGLDLGSKRIGVSICDEKQSIATPFKTINKTNNDDLINELKKIIEENNIKGIVIGYPINMDGTLGPSAQSVSDVSKNIDKNIDVDVCLWDERLSTVGAFGAVCPSIFITLQREYLETGAKALGVERKAFVKPKKATKSAERNV